MKQDRGSSSSPQRIACWFCEHGFTPRQVLRDGIIRSRTERAGGPYRLFVCPSCGRENVCEKTGRGRWFSSPNYRLSFLDYLFSQVLDPRDAETLLAAITWFRENEDRRRYFFERDGDLRYSGRSFIRRIWPSAPPQPPGREKARPRPPREEEPAARGTDREPPPRKRPGIQGVVTPQEILGVRPDASAGEIRDAFHRLAIHYHPDKVHHLGQEFEEVAKEKFLRLKEAYEVLMGMRAARR